MPRITYLSPKEEKTLDSKYYTPKELATLLGISKSLLQHWRTHKTGPKYIKAGYRTIRYMETDVAHYIDAQTCDVTSSQKIL